MRRQWLILVAMVSIVGCTVTSIGGIRGNGNMTSETRDVGGFTEIVLEGSGHVIVEIAGTESLTIEAEDNLMPRLTSDVENGRLILGSRGSLNPTRQIVYTINATVLDGLTLSGSGEIEAAGVHGGDLTAAISGSGTIDLTDLGLERLEGTISGSGNIDVSGTATGLEVTISGSGQFDGEDLEAEEATVEIPGSGSAVVNATDELHATVSGSGHVEYLGDPTVDSNITGSGSIGRR